MVIAALIAALPCTVLLFSWLTVRPYSSRVTGADRVRSLELAAARQDLTADDHQYRLADSPADLTDWLARRGATWEPASLTGGMALRISQPERASIVIEPGQTLHWDGERVTVTR
ncbi:hypothetical protein [Streptomyces xanthophaeus]|uniref:hypothetical protein n=1 Tax=Streptomyces xanthophaeus TaxID=67385 RepID=UPI0037134764